jgi:hypothetical protein
MPAAAAIAKYTEAVFRGSAMARVTITKSSWCSDSAGEGAFAAALLADNIAARRSLASWGGQSSGKRFEDSSVRWTPSNWSL